MHLACQACLRSDDGLPSVTRRLSSINVGRTPIICQLPSFSQESGDVHLETCDAQVSSPSMSAANVPANVRHTVSILIPVKPAAGDGWRGHLGGVRGVGMQQGCIVGRTGKGSGVARRQRCMGAPAILIALYVILACAYSAQSPQACYCRFCLHSSWGGPQQRSAVGSLCRRGGDCLRHSFVNKAHLLLITDCSISTLRRAQPALRILRASSTTLKALSRLWSPKAHLSITDGWPL